jgi:type II secretory pathway component PulF
MKRKVTIAIVTVFVMALFAVPTFASGFQDPVPTLALSADAVQSGLFTGANIMLGALGAILFLVIGIGFGKKIFDVIGNAISRAF